MHNTLKLNISNFTIEQNERGTVSGPGSLSDSIVSSSPSDGMDEGPAFGIPTGPDGSGSWPDRLSVVGMGGVTVGLVEGCFS